MRKALSFVLVLALIMGSFSFAFAADTESTTYSDIAGKDCEGAVTVLSAIGVVNGYADGTYKPEKVVTRAEMAKLLIVALGMDEYVKGTYTSFSDVKNHWANSYIAYAASMGIIEGYPDGTFRPDNTVTYQEAVTMIVRALGYQDQYLTGTWPASHVSMAKSLGILKDIVATADGANRGDVAIMLYNAIALPTVTYTTTGDLDQTGSSMLERLDATCQGRAILDADGALGFEYAEGVDLSDFYGYNVKVYTIEDDNDDDVIVAVGDIKGTAYEVELTGDTTFKYNDKDYNIDQTTKDDDKLYTGVNIVNNHIGGNLIVNADDDTDMATIIVNGSLSQSATKLYSTIQWQVNGAKLVDDDDVTDIANGIEDADDMNDFLGTALDLVYDDDDEAFDVTVEGAASALKDIAEDDVIYLYAYKGDIEKIAVARDKAEGNVTKVNKDGDKFTISGKTYELSDYQDMYNGDIDGLDEDAVGDDWTFYLGPDGKIFAAEAVDAMGDYALVIAKESKNNFEQKTGKIKVMDNTGAVVELTLKGTGDEDSNVYADVKFTNEGDVVAAGLDLDELSAQDIITYATNSAGKVTEIEKYATKTVTEKMSKKGVYDGYVASKDTIIFTYDADKKANDEDAYELGSFAKIAGSDDPFEATYVLDKKDIVAMLVGDEVGGSDDSYGMINAVSNIQNADEDKIFEYEALIDGKEVVLNTEDRDMRNTGSTVAGEFFVFEIDGEGVVTGVKQVTTGMNVDNDGIDALAGIKFKEVTDIDKNAGWIEIGGVKYSIGDNQVVYKMVFDNDEFDSYAIGSFSNVAEGAYVIGFDTVDDDEDMIDTFVVVTRANYNDNKAYLDRAWTPAP